MKPWLVVVKESFLTVVIRVLLQLLPLKRPKNTVDWNKCLICQSTNSKETLRKASADGTTTFNEACSKRQDDVFE